MDSKKSNKIRDIVRLQQILKKWRKLATSSKTNKTAVSASAAGKGIQFLKRTLSSSSSASGREGSGGVVPKGYLAVSVGEEMKRFVISTQCLSHPAFQMLLREAEEEFGFQQAGVLRLPCEVFQFENVLKMVEEKKKMMKGGFGGDGVLDCYCSSENLVLLPCIDHRQSPMCR